MNKIQEIIDLAKIPNNVFRYHQLVRGRCHEDWEDYIYTALEDNFTLNHVDSDLKEMARLDGDKS